MTDRIDHYAEAEGWLHVAETGPSPQGPLALATVHALLAIADRLAVKPCETCARRDAYAAREAEQRAAAAHEYEWVYVEGAVEKCRPNPLDESDHRDRLDTDGDRLSRRANGLWSYEDEEGLITLAEADELRGPLTVAPDQPQGAASSHDTPPSTPAGPQGGLWDGSKSQRRNLNAQTDLLCPSCGHDIDRHIIRIDGMRCRDWRGCECHWWPSWIAAKLIKQAVKEAAQ